VYGIDIVIGQQDHSRDRTWAGNGWHRERENSQIPAFVDGGAALLDLAEDHLQTKNTQYKAAGDLQ